MFLNHVSIKAVDHQTELNVNPSFTKPFGTHTFYQTPTISKPLPPWT